MQALDVYNAELIAGGRFTTAGEHVSVHWARWGPPCLPGDLDSDGDVDLDDYVIFEGCITGPMDSLAADYDHDGDVDLDDFTAWEQCLAGPGAAPGAGCEDMDLDADSDVDLDDFAVFQRSFTGPGGLLPECAIADFDTDSDLDLADFAGFQVVFEQ